MPIQRTPAATAMNPTANRLNPCRQRPLWRERRLSGVLADAPSRRFLALAASALLDAGMLRLHVLHIRGQAVAAYCGLLDGARACYYIGGFDPAWARCSPGTQVIGYAIEEAIAAGATSFDFLRGREPYKHRWGATACPTYKRVLRPE